MIACNQVYVQSNRTKADVDVHFSIAYDYDGKMGSLSLTLHFDNSNYDD